MNEVGFIVFMNGILIFYNINWTHIIEVGLTFEEVFVLRKFKKACKKIFVINV